MSKPRRDNSFPKNSRDPLTLGTACYQSKEFSRARDFCAEALVGEPANAVAWLLLGVCCLQTRNFDKGNRVLHRVLRVDSSNAEAYENLGVAKLRAGDVLEAMRHLEGALVLTCSAPEPYVQSGVCLDKLDLPAEAVRRFMRAIRLGANRPDVFNALGKSLSDDLRFKDAIEAFRAAIVQRPSFPDAYFNMACSYLALGDYSHGWSFFEWRWHSKTGPRPRSLSIDMNFKCRAFGESLRDGVGLLHAEQGLGDTIQFCRYARKVRELGAQVVLQVPDALLRLLRGQEGFGEVIGQSEGVPSFDYHCPLMSLPLAFGTTLETIPYGKEAYLEALPEDVARWRERLGEADRLRVGVVWNGGFRPGQPELWAVNARRNVPLEVFARHLDIEGVDFYSLQKGDPAESELRGREGEYWRRGRLYNYTAELHDFADTAGLIANLDLVISVDTSTAHLAAALGKPTWILNRYDTCWRWLLDREDSPWYGSVKLYRQSQDRDWTRVLQRVENDLLRRVEQHCVISKPVTT